MSRPVQRSIAAADTAVAKPLDRSIQCSVLCSVQYHLVMKKLNSFEMLPKESANEMYSRLNVLIEEVNELGLTQMQPSDVVRKILSVLLIDKYGHIMAVLHQGDLFTTTLTQILGKINAHEIYMHITPQDGSSSTKKKDKDLAFTAS